MENARIPLTAVAVARQALKTQSYVQAADTLRGALARSSQRVDLRLLLAEVLWEADFRFESAELAMDVLAKLPDCLSANRIMAGLWLTEGRPTDAQRYINHLESVDPYLAVELVTGQLVEDNAFRLEELDFRRSAKSVVADESPDWLADITGGAPSPTSSPARTTEFETITHDPPADDQWDQWVSAMLQGTAKPTEKAPPPSHDWLEAEKSVLESGELNPFHLKSTGELDEIDAIFETGTFPDDSGQVAEDPVAWLRERGLEIEEDAEVLSPGAQLLSDTDEEFVMPEPNDPTAWMGRYNLEMSDEPDNLFGDDEPLTSIGSPDLSSADDESFDWMDDAPSQTQDSALEDISAIPDWTDDPPASPPQATNALSDPAEVPRPRRGLTAMFNDTSFDWSANASADDDSDDEWLAQFDDKKKLAAVTTTSPDWLSSLDGAEFDNGNPDTGTLTWGNEVPQSGGDEMPDNTSGINADANDNDDAFSWMNDFDDVPQSDNQPVSADVPDWLSELKPSDESDASSPSADSSDENDLGWMSSISGGDDEPNSGIEEEFAWMDETAAEDTTAPSGDMAVAAPPSTSASDDAFDWMNGIDFGDEPAKNAEPVPDWLNEVLPSADIETPADVESAFGDELATDPEDAANWMSEFGDLNAPANPDASFEIEPEADAVPDWLSELAPKTASPAEPASVEADIVTSILDEDTNWMSELGDLRPEIDSEFDAAAEPAEAPPDWLSELDPEQETLTPGAAVAANAGDDLDWMDAFSATPATEGEPAAEMTPDWLSELEPETEAESADEDDFNLDIEAVAETTPDWLSELELDAEPAAADELAVESEASPDWLSELEPETEIPAAPVDVTASAVASIDWMDEFVVETPAAEPETDIMQPAAESTPDWLSELEPEAEIEGDAEITPDWLTEVEPESAAGGVEPNAVTDIDWLSDLDLESAELEPEAESVTESTPDWLSELEPETEVEADAETTPDWLAEVEPEAESSADIDWLSELETEPVAAEFDAFNMPLSEVDAMAAPPSTPNAEIDWVSDLEPELDLDDALEVPVPAEEFASLLESDVEPEPVPDAPETAIAADTSDEGILPYTEDDAVIAATPEEEFAAAAVAAEDMMPIIGAETVSELIPSEVAESDVITEDSSSVTEADNAPDWLNAMVPGLDVDYAPTESPDAETPQVDEASPREFAWLNNMVDEEMAEAAASAFNFTKTPAWLDRLIPPAQPAAPQPDEDFPDWVSDDDEADLPEWLR